MLYREHKTQDVKRGKLNEKQAEKEEENDEKQEKRAKWTGEAKKNERRRGYAAR